MVDYTKACQPTAGQEASSYENCQEFLSEKNNTGKSCHCTVGFDLEQDFKVFGRCEKSQCNTWYIIICDLFKGKVYMYYGLSNFYQNHRRYVKSRDDNQLLGGRQTASDLSGDCEPFKAYNETTNIGYAPCGAIANSLFNGKF